MNRFIRPAALGAAVALLVPAAAGAHVTLQPSEAPAGGFQRLDVRVPNERDSASTRKVEVRFPSGFVFISHQPVPGWRTTVKMAKLATPVEVFGEEHSEQVETVTFTAQGAGIAPGQFQDFGLSLALPDKPGTALTFKALQRYSNGEVVRWIGEPDSDEPAPQVKLTAAAEESGAAHAPSGEAAGGEPAPGEPASGEAGGGSDTLAVIALIVGALGLLAGVLGLAAARRARTAASGEAAAAA